MPAVVLERQKISRQVYDSLKVHVMRERQKKKEEQEADAEVERQRREREDQQKEHKMTLEETKEQLAELETRLAQLKEDKHQLFIQLKKVLNEDETRRRIKESNEMMAVHGYGPNTLGLPGSHPPQLYAQAPGVTIAPRPMYKVGPQPVQQLSHSISVTAQLPQKRTRTPSPPPQLYHPSYYKGIPVSSPYPVATSSPTVVYGSYYPHHGPPSGTNPSTMNFNYGPAPPTQIIYSSAGSSSTRSVTYASKEEPKHSPLYAPQSQPQPGRGCVGALHGLAEHMSRPSDHYLASHLSGSSHGHLGSIPASSASHSRSIQVLSHPFAPSLHQPVLPVQPGQGKGGSITSGHPARSQPPPGSIPVYSTATPMTAYLASQSQRMIYTQSQQSSSNPNNPQPQGRYYGGPQRD